MKPKNPSIIQVTLLEVESCKSGNKGRWNHNSLAKRTTLKTRNEFIKPHTEYVVTILPDGFKIKNPTIDDHKIHRSTICSHLYCGGVEPGLYEITEQTEDFIIAKKQKA